MKYFETAKADLCIQIRVAESDNEIRPIMLKKTRNGKYRILIIEFLEIN